MSTRGLIKNIEKIKEEHKYSFAKQEMLLKEPVSELSRIVVDSEGINNLFGSLVSEHLSKSDFTFFNLVKTLEYPGDENYCSNAVGYGDYLSIRSKYNKVYEIFYQTSDKRTSVILGKVKKNVIRLHKYVVVSNDTVYTSNSDFVEKDGMYYQTSLKKLFVKKTDNFATTYSESLNYDIDSDELSKTLCVSTKEDDQEISNTKVKSIISKDDYIISDGLFYLINKPVEKNKMKRVKKLENELLENILG